MSRRYIVLQNDWPTELIDGYLHRSSKYGALSGYLRYGIGATVFSNARAARRAVQRTCKEWEIPVEQWHIVPLATAPNDA